MEYSDGALLQPQGDPLLGMWPRPTQLTLDTSFQATMTTKVSSPMFYGYDHAAVPEEGIAPAMGVDHKREISTDLRTDILIPKSPSHGRAGAKSPEYRSISPMSITDSRPGSPIKRRDPRDDTTLACPYYRRDKLRYEPCLKLRLARIGDVKQHIYRHHWIFPQFYCSTCWETFDTDSQRYVHAQQATCTSKPEPEWHGVTQEQKKEFGKAAPQRSSIEVQWLKMWHDIFGWEVEEPASVYVSNVLDEGAQMVEDYYAKHVAEVVKNVTNVVREAMGSRWDEATLGLAEGIAQQAISELQAQFRSEMQLARPNQKSEDRKSSVSSSSVSSVGPFVVSRTQSPEIRPPKANAQGSSVDLNKIKPSRPRPEQPLATWEHGSAFATINGLPPPALGGFGAAPAVADNSWARSPISSPPLRSEDNTPRPKYLAMK